jgi:hypothetical protein
VLFTGRANTHNFDTTLPCGASLLLLVHRPEAQADADAGVREGVGREREDVLEDRERARVLLAGVEDAGLADERDEVRGPAREHAVERGGGVVEPERRELRVMNASTPPGGPVSAAALSSCAAAAVCTSLGCSPRRSSASGRV